MLEKLKEVTPVEDAQEKMKEMEKMSGVMLKTISFGHYLSLQASIAGAMIVGADGDLIAMEFAKDQVDELLRLNEAHVQGVDIYE